MTDPIARIRIDLGGARPPIWRRVDVPVTLTLHELHDVIQRAFAWENSHLHQFTVGERVYGPPEYELDEVFPGVCDSRKTRLVSLLSDGIERFTYTYDFGDNWVHKLVVEQFRAGEPDTEYPALVKARRRGPPEDIGGVYAYEERLALLRDPSDEHHEETVEWLGKGYDADEVDWESAHRNLASIAVRHKKGLEIMAGHRQIRERRRHS